MSTVMNKQMAVVFVLLLASQLSTASQCEVTDRLAVRVANEAVDAEDFPNALLKVAARFDIPIGIEWVQRPRTLAEVSVLLREGTVEDLFAAVVKTQPGYLYDVQNGVLHVYPAELREGGQSVVDIRLASFEVQNEFVRFAAARLRSMVARIMLPRPPSLGPSGSGGSAATGLGDERVTLRVENVTVRDVLDQLACAAGLPIWMIVYPERPEVTTSGYWKTASPIASYVADDNQPIWVFLARGQDRQGQYRPEFLPPPSDIHPLETECADAAECSSRR